MAARNVLSRPGLYDISSTSWILGHYQFDASGTTWAETTVGNRFYLINGAANGAAIDEILEGRIAVGNQGLASSPININTAIQGGLHLSGGGSPEIKWLQNTTSSRFYKAINVIDADTIEVEALAGTAGTFRIEGIATRGYNVKSVELNIPSGQSMLIGGYQFNNPLSGQIYSNSQSLPIDLENDGPLYIEGGGISSVLVHADAGTQRRS